MFASQAWTQVKARLQFLVDHHGTGLLTGEVGSGKSTAARTFTAALNPNLYKILYLHWSSGSAARTGVERAGGATPPATSVTGTTVAAKPRREAVTDGRSRRAARRGPTEIDDGDARA